MGHSGNIAFNFCVRNQMTVDLPDGSFYTFVHMYHSSCRTLCKAGLVRADFILIEGLKVYVKMCIMASHPFSKWDKVQR